ncbi:MAG: hypothetical protein COW47_00580 [Candidatus Huberarchaeum crystalense]|uniref:50S ribosomal protein L1 n=1 Tax=Huberarchaeum crystalense TaxID=2014257 RepID=A0A2G9LJS7_HUBC1|nr:hypothetical protein [archaeon]OIP20903.1 MAG: hypothetical protein AUJ91_00015 [archaeon CG2_30_31_98]PIN66771.1 MAG: hypothetical protein COW69_00545 [Candidatus Huberarchaeum crystalense]NCS98336.1 hypothetical protein [archaeon]PIV13791.1 MAG: hypothetical protein COS45_00935 [Candidatus Huberarchaeum crystalense]
MKIEQAIAEMKKNVGKRNFVQSYDVVFLLQNIDVKKPDQRIKLEVILPHSPFKKPHSLAVIAKTTTNLGKISYQQGLDVIEPIYLESIAQDKKKIKHLANKFDAFLCDVVEVRTMARILGAFLGPKNKMPLMVSGAEANLAQHIKKISRIVRLSTGMQMQLQTLFGYEKMDDSQLIENFNAVVAAVLAKLPKGRTQLKKVFIKQTMAAPVAVEI